MSPIVQALAAWLLAYAVHSTLLLGAAALLAGRVRDYAWRETLWKCALVGAVLTVSVQTLADFTSLAGRLFEGDVATMVSHLLTAKDVEAEDLERIKVVIARREAELKGGAS